MKPKILVCGNANSKYIQRDLIKRLIDLKFDVEYFDPESDFVQNVYKLANTIKMYESQKIGIVRYNAFKDTGSDLSFSLAILDAHNNGVVLNGIYARDSSNIYAKPIENGQSKYILSNEEKEAIYKAMNNVK